MFWVKWKKNCIKIPFNASLVLTQFSLLTSNFQWPCVVKLLTYSKIQLIEHRVRVLLTNFQGSSSNIKGIVGHFYP